MDPLTSGPEYLALMLAAYMIGSGFRELASRRSLEPVIAPGWLHRALISPWKPLFLAVPTTLILWAGHRHVGLDAIMDRAIPSCPIRIASCTTWCSSSWESPCIACVPIFRTSPNTDGSTLQRRFPRSLAAPP